MASVDLTKAKRYQNMDVVRYILALIVIINHFDFLNGNFINFPIDSYIAVGGFFALSGFLTYSGYEKSPRFKPFLKKRCKRLLPGYFIIVLLCAVGLFFVSTLDFEEYFLSKDFFKYLAANLSMMNFIHPSLPGVFDGMAVNGSLWTVKVEFLLYFTVPVVYYVVKKLGASRRDLVFFGLYILAVAYRILFQYLADATGKEFYMILSNQFIGQMTFFYAGAFFYYHKEKLLQYRWIIAPAALLFFLFFRQIYVVSVIFYPMVISVVVILLSMWGKWGAWGNNINNVSYEMYLFHFPIIQTIIYLGLKNTIGFYPTLLISLAITIALSIAVWFTADKPFIYRPHSHK